jgi:hypothetical protein
MISGSISPLFEAHDKDVVLLTKELPDNLDDVSMLPSEGEKKSEAMPNLMGMMRPDIV